VNMSTDRPVVIAGAGPVGCVLALYLARAGVPVVLLERGAELPEDLRASTFHPPTLDMLEDLELTPALLGLGVLAPTYQYRDRRSGAHAIFDLAVLEGETQHPYRLQCEQFKLTRLACERLQAFPHARVQFDSKVEGFRALPDGVEVDVRVAGVVQPIAASYLVGADGAHSAVRRHAGIEFEGITYPEKFLVLSTGAALEQAMPNLSGVNYVADGVEWCTILKTRTLWRVLFPAEPELPDEALVADDAVQARLQALAPSREAYQVEHRTLYRVHQRVAASFRRGRVLLAGDAAHVNNPLGGMGMNGGIHDALALGRAFERAFNGADPDTALDAYCTSRRRVAVEFINAQAARNKQQMEERDPDKRAAHLAEMCAIASDPRRSRDYLMKGSMIEALRREGWSGGR
jgi:3-(3-hydroxy-phenyl)propionate hydroxylase